MKRAEQAISQRRASSGSPVLHQRRSLQDANEVSLNLSGNQLDPSQDPRGQRLRQIRKAQGLDPSSVATQACISLGQLYELETGGERLFYSTTLRDQAGRRVAQLLGEDWDALAEANTTADEHPDAQAAGPIEPSVTQARKSVDPSQEDHVTPPTGLMASVLRWLVWGLVLVVTGLSAVRMGWWPGLRLPL